MKKIFAVLAMVSCVAGGADAATARRSARATASQSVPTANAARSATTARVARAPVSGNTTAPRATAARSATPKQPVASAPKTVAARAGTTQKVISTGTKVATAVQNVVVGEECTAKFNGCMDSFCMLDNENGGRCICSNKHATFDSILEEIEALDQRSYEMATLGVEQVEMGVNADSAISIADSVVEKLDAKKKRDRIDLSMWSSKDDDVESISLSELDGKKGDELYAAVANICRARIPECASDLQMLQMMYSRQIQSDCAAYENSLKQKKNKAIENLDTAERTLRQAALEQYEAANKYDLGQCTVRFKECMQTTAGCGDDFSGCAQVVAMESTDVKTKNNKQKSYVIQGALSGVVISASTYDTLMAKKTMCESVTKQCVDVADQVFDAFLRDVAPQVKAAELIAEDKMRQNCVVNISDCFQQACKDNIDPNDPDGSYDMCLTRPEAMLNLCKVPLNACGINTMQDSVAQQSPIWNYVLDRLASMRVDACTTQIKDCLRDKDRCGSDYTQCLGLDIDSVVNMCPMDKLVACNSSAYGADVSQKVNYVYSVAQGILLGIDNTFYAQCESAVKNKMVELCGSVYNCNADQNELLGKNSLLVRQQADGDWLIDGTVMFGSINMSHPTDNGVLDGGYKVTYNATIDDENVWNRINQTVIADIQSELNRKMSILMTDPTINMCINGRDMSQITRGAGRDTARFPNLLVPYANVMFNSLIDTAMINYNLEYANAFSKANSLSEQYKNTLFCNAMVKKNQSPVEMAQSQAGVKEYTDYSVLIAGTFDKNMLDAINEGADAENIVYVDEVVANEKHKTEIAREKMSAVYEPGPKVCRITKTIYPCVGYDSAFNSESSSWSAGATVMIAGTGGGFTSGGSESSTKYVGKYCSQYAEPLITEQIINFADENVIAGNITRSNVTSMVVNNNQVTNSKSTSVGVSLSADVSSDQTVNIENNSGTINNNGNGTVNTNKK